MLLTILAYRSGQLVFEEDIETDCPDLPAIAAGMQRALDCGRVVILRDGEFAYDTADKKARPHRLRGGGRRAIGTRRGKPWT